MSKILLVEDSGMQRGAVKIFIKNGGHNVEDYENYDLASSALEKFQFDLCVLDIETTGDKTIYDFIRELKTKKSDVPVVVLSARIKSQAEKELSELGITEFLWKPIRENELQEVIENQLKK
ncbi:MAG: response regulator [Bdellovibrionales bacterium]|nr:response regulator [Bdellovibrionales bacterium]